MQLSGLLSNLEWLAITSQYLFNLALVFTVLAAGLNQDLNFCCFSHFKANFIVTLSLRDSKDSRLSLFKALVYEMYD